MFDISQLRVNQFHKRAQQNILSYLITMNSGKKALHQKCHFLSCLLNEQSPLSGFWAWRDEWSLQMPAVVTQFMESLTKKGDENSDTVLDDCYNVTDLLQD